jgi:cytochrome c oxidase subunit 2
VTRRGRCSDVRRGRARSRHPLGGVACLVASALVAGCAADQSIFAPHGESSRPIAVLGWTLTIIALLVVLVVTVLVVVALFHRRPAPDQLGGEAAHAWAEAGERSGRRWILIGTALSTVVLLGAFVYSLRVLVGYSGGTDRATMTVRVTGYRFWWALDYLDARGRTDFTTANELHVPVGARVKIELEAGDVIHSFWVPELAGKTDLIPGQHNVMWIEADRPGRYVGQCAEFCGPSHANMRIVVFVDPPDVYAAWAARQRLPATPLPDAMRLVQARGCAACHTIAGTAAAGRAGPDLTHVGSRTTLASGILSNTPKHMAAWLSNPDSVKPAVLMPRTGVHGADLAMLVRFLEGLR